MVLDVPVSLWNGMRCECREVLTRGVGKSRIVLCTWRPRRFMGRVEVYVNTSFGLDSYFEGEDRRENHLLRSNVRRFYKEEKEN